jgi:hypothetical protein
MWFHKDLFAVTVGGGQMNNPGRYLTLLPPINGANAFTGTPYFTENPGDRAHMWDSTVNFQYMPNQYITWWAEVGYRHADIPYFAGRHGVTPPGATISIRNSTRVCPALLRVQPTSARPRSSVADPERFGFPTFAEVKPRSTAA